MIRLALVYLLLAVPVALALAPIAGRFFGMSGRGGYRPVCLQCGDPRCPGGCAWWDGGAP